MSDRKEKIQARHDGYHDALAGETPIYFGEYKSDYQHGYNLGKRAYESGNYQPKEG